VLEGGFDFLVRRPGLGLIHHNMKDHYASLVPPPGTAKS
jgi:hypothetical protein